MNLKENRKLAFIVLAAAIIISIGVMGPVSLMRSHSKAAELFMQGDNREMILRCAEQGALLGQMSDVYLADAAIDQYASAQTASALRAGDYTALPATLQSLSADLKAATDPNTCLAILIELNTAVEKTYTGLEMLDIADDDFRNIKLSYYDYKGALDILSREETYAEAAARFNKQAKGFPAGLFCDILNIAPLTTYGG